MSKFAKHCAFSVIIPTHDHGPIIDFAIRSVLRQTLQDFELLIVGDGISEVGRETVLKAQSQDSRVRFFDLPKGPRLGEAYRHHIILEEARGQNICYLCDDDMLFPECLHHMASQLKRHDFVHPLPVFITVDGQYGVASGFLGLDVVRRRIVEDLSYNFIGLTGTCHTMKMYRKLPHGWRTTPEGIATDHYMWQQVLAQSWCNAYTYPRPLTLHFPDKPRRPWTLEERSAELFSWEQRMLAHDGEMQLATQALAYLLQVCTEQAEKLRHPTETRRPSYLAG